MRKLLFLIYLSISLVEVLTDPCSQTCSSNQFKTANCVPAVDEIVVDPEVANPDSTPGSNPGVTFSGTWFSGAVTALGSCPATGIRGSIFWFDTNPSVNKDQTFVEYEFTVPQPGEYNVSVTYIYESGCPLVQPGQYTVTHDDGTTSEIVDHNEAFGDNGRLIGTFDFTTSGTVKAIAAPSRQENFMVDAVIVRIADDTLFTGTPPTCQDYTECDQLTQFESVEPTSTSDRQCSNTTICNNDQFETVVPTTTSDRQCQDCKDCNHDQYQVQACTPTSDASCADCDSCQPGKFISQNCSDVSNTVCSSCQTCDTGFFIEHGCGEFTDTVCKECSSCELAQFVSSNCTETTDTKCQDCSSCQPGFFQSADCSTYFDTQCQECSECGINEYVALACSDFRDTICLSCGSCDEEQYVEVACTATSNAVCTNCTECGDTQFETVECTASSNRQCQDCDSCEVDQFYQSNCTATSNAVCVDCASCDPDEYVVSSCSTFMDTQCESCDTCSPTQFETVACTATSNRECQDCEICDPDQYETADCTETSDRTCEDCDECLPSEFQVSDCTATSNRVCDDCATCETDEFISQNCTATSNTICTECTTCKGDEYIISNCTEVENTVCGQCTQCENDEYLVQECTTTSNSICSQCTACTQDQYLVAECTATSDTICADYTVCTNDQYETISATSTSDRSCQNCTICPRTLVPCSEFANAECSEDCAICPTGSYLQECKEDAEFMVVVDSEDESRVSVSPEWTVSSSIPPFIGSSYLLARGSDLGAEVVFDVDIFFDYTYDIYVSFSAQSSRQSTVIVTIQSDVAATQVTVNQKVQGSFEGAFTKVSSIRAVSRLNVTISPDSNFPNDEVVADAVLVTSGPDAVNDGLTSFCGDCTVCTQDQWQVSACNSFNNTVCSPLTVCKSDEYESVAPTSTSNRQCLPLRICESDQFISVNETATSNRQCQDITECETDQYEDEPATRFTDAVCRTLTDCNFPDKYEDVPATPTSDRVCKDVSTCSNDQYISIDATPTSDLTCSDIIDCLQDQYETKAPTSTSNRECSDITECEQDEYISKAETATSDRICTELTPCDPDEYESVAATLTTDRECAECKECVDQIVVSECSETENTVCRDPTVPFQYGQWSEWSESCGIQTRTRQEICNDDICINPQPTTESKDVNGECEQLCSILRNPDPKIICSCLPGYELELNNRNCSEISCGSAPNVANAQVITTGDIFFQESATYQCSSGYKVKGQFNVNVKTFSRSCLADGSFGDTDAGCDDINECLDNNGGCGAAACTNLDGTNCCAQDTPWTYTTWSDWSTTCGVGVRTRSPVCLAQCGGSCTNPQETTETRDICCPGTAEYTYGEYPLWQPVCNLQFRQREEYCNATCGGQCTNKQNTTESLMNGGCDQGCIPPSDFWSQIVCTCDPGYELLSDRRTCVIAEPCKDDNGGCDQICKDLGQGTYECQCEDGYFLVNNKLCLDINECLTDNGGCEQLCVNSQGSYECACQNGYEIDSLVPSKCLPKACATAPSLPNAVYSGSTPSTDLVFGDDAEYQCSSGFGVNGNSQETSFSLSCESDGTFSGNFDGCSDIDECQVNNAGCEQTCSNINGGFECSCENGYSLEDGFSCVDINECETDNGGCQHVCTNTQGSFTCSCNNGFVLKDDSKSCAPSTCSSPQDEIGGALLQPVHSDIVFESLITYKCPQGFHLEGEEISTTTFTVSCQADGQFSDSDAQCVDIDECDEDIDGCDHSCQNTEGSFSCVCDDGYTLVGQTQCQDVNECDSPLSCVDNADCINLEGSYSCQCRSGFVDTSTNQDVSECTQVQFDLLAEGSAASGAVKFGTFAFFSGSPSRLEQLPSFKLSSKMSLVAEVQQKPNTGGYILARTSQSGSRRNLAVYVFQQQDSIGLWYVTEGSSITRSTSFDSTIPIHDGQIHRIMLTIDGQTAQLIVDGQSMGQQQLQGLISDCSGSDCITYVGQRSSSTGGAAGFEGLIRSLKLYTNEVKTSQPELVDLPSPSSTEPTMIDMLSSNTFSIGNPMFLQSGGVNFNGQSALVSQSFNIVSHPDTGSFSFSATLKMPLGTSGYIMSKSADADKHRYYSLYVSAATSRLFFFYKIRTSDERQSLSFDIHLADGLYHRLMLTVETAKVNIFVDGSLKATSDLMGIIDDCSPSSSTCFLQIGRRTSSSSVSGDWFITGEFLSATMYTQVALPFDFSPFPPVMEDLDQTLPKDENNHAYLNMLNSSVHTVANSVVSTDTGFILDGTGGIRIVKHSFDLSSSFSIFMDVTVSGTPTPEGGYLFAKTNAAGNVRYWSLYLSSSNERATFYYKRVNSPDLLSVQFSQVSIQDDQRHSVLLSVDGTAASLFIDGVLQSTQTLDGQVDDCGAASSDCILYLGLRSDDSSNGRAFELKSELHQALLYPEDAIMPSELPNSNILSPPYFSVTSNSLLPGLNIESYNSGVTAAECAEKCLSNPQCKSFDAGTVGGLREGACFLSDTTATEAGVNLTPTILFTYYEKL